VRIPTIKNQREKNFSEKTRAAETTLSIEGGEAALKEEDEPDRSFQEGGRGLAGVGKRGSPFDQPPIFPKAGELVNMMGNVGSKDDGEERTKKINQLSQGAQKPKKGRKAQAYSSPWERMSTLSKRSPITVPNENNRPRERTLKKKRF